MKAKVLYCYYSDGSGYQIVRVYLEDHFEQSVKDHELLIKFSNDRNWKLEDVEIYGIRDVKQVQ